MQPARVLPVITTSVQLPPHRINILSILSMVYSWSLPRLLSPSHGDRIFQMHRSICSLILMPPPVRACQWYTQSISQALPTWRSPTRASIDAWWKMNESASSSSPGQAADSSGNGRTALLQNITGTSHWVAGKFGNALSLDGSNDYGFTLNYKGITGNARRTIALWFKTSTANKPILQYGASGTATLFKLSLNSSGAAVLDLGGTSVTSSTSGHADGNWHHLAGIHTRQWKYRRL